MNTDNANKYLNERQIYQRDVWDSKDIEHPLDCLLEDYHQKQLKLLGIADVVEPKSKLEMFQNMQYYMEHCQREGYITPQDWLEKEKHF